MHTSSNARIRKILAGFLLAAFLLSLLTTGGSPAVHAQEAGTPVPTDQTVERVPFQDGRVIEEHSIIGLVEPPPGFEEERQPVILPKTGDTTIESIGLPGSQWLFGCSAGAAQEVAAGYDQPAPNCPGGLITANDAVSTAGLCCQVTGLVNIYSGPTNGGIMPIIPPAPNPWPTWMDRCGQTYPNNPLVASHMDVDGRSTRGTIDDYWDCYDSTAPDPYITNGWTEHEWGDAMGDYMFTSESKYGNVDGQTKFYIYANSPDPLTADDAAAEQLPDGTLGMRNFYEARGYVVDAAYNQPTSNAIAGGFTLAQYKAEIDSGRPVMIHLENTPQGHTIVGIGYDSATNEVLLHDGWDDQTHKMPWGGSYAGMTMKMVSIVHPLPVDVNKYTISGYVGAPNVTINYNGGSTTSRANGYYTFAVSPGWSGTVTPSKTGYTFDPPSRPYSNVSAFQMKQHFTATPVALQDPGFELGDPNPYWTGTSTNFPSPLCTVDTCGTGPNASPRTGSAWGWFGGTTANEIATLSQPVTIANGVSASLKFYLWIGSADAGSNSLDVFTAKVDNTIVFSANATQINAYSDYKLVSVDISAFADGDSHTIEFRSETTGQQVDFNLDDVALVTVSLTDPPDQFNKIAPPNGAINQPLTLNLSWQASTGAVSYSYCIDETDDDACSVWVSTGTSTSATVTNLKSNTIYYWQVSASNANGTTYALGGYWHFTTVGFETTYNGTTSRGQPMSFIVSPTGTQWEEFKLKTDYPACSLTIELTIFGPGPISSGKFSASVSGFSFSGQVKTDGTALGSYSFNNYNANGCKMTQSGTWTASKPMPPKVTSITRLDASPTSADSVDFKVLFSENVTGVDISGPPFDDFTLVIGSGLTGVSITSVSGSLAEYVVTVNTGSGNGTIRLDVVDNDTIMDADNTPLGGTGAGNGNYSSGAVYTVNRGTPSVLALIAPPNNGLVTDYTPRLDWSNSTIPAGTIFDHYQLQVATDAAFNNLVVDETIPGIANSEYTFTTDLASNSKFYWHVRASNYKGGTSNWSVARPFRTALLPPTLVSPAEAFASPELRPAFDWNDVATATGYTIQVSKNQQFTQVIHTGNPIVSTYVPTVDLPKNTLLYWRVLTKGTNGPSAPSEVRTFHTPVLPPPTPVLTLPATNALVTDTTPAFTWKPVVMPVGTTFQNYILQVDDSADFGSPVVNETALVTTTFTPGTDLATNTKFYWRVRAVNSSGEMSNWSAVWTLRAALLPPSVVAPVDGATGVAKMPLLDWSDVSGNSGYVLQVWKAGTTPVLVKSVTLATNVSQYQFITNLLPNTAYFWKVQTKGTNGPSLWSENFDFTTGP